VAEGRNKRRAARQPGTPSPAKPRPTSLQRKVGNRAVSGMVESLRASDDTQDAGPVPWEHPTFERQADDIASRAQGMRGGRDTRQHLDGAPLATHDAAKLRELTGKDVSKVRLHAGGDSQGKAAAMGAHAFTSGTDIHFGKGEYDPGSPKGFELLAHEVTHAVQHPQGHDHAGNELVHAKLKGTKQALEDLGGKAKKSLLKSIKGSRWNELLSQLGSYEKHEAEYAALLAKPTVKGYDKAEAKLRAKLLKALLSLETVAQQWQTANDQEGADSIKERSDANWDDDEEDVRTKGQRRQAVALFLARVRVEKTDIERGQFGTGLDDTQLDWGKDDAVGGGMNRLDQVAYASSEGPILEGYFKEDRGFAKQTAGHDKKAGIGQYDANFAGRSIAMYRLDKLLEGGVIARTEFAVHTSKNRKEAKRKPGESNLTESTTKLGFVTEKAKGEEMGNLLRNDKVVRDAENAGPDTVAMEDPVLQRCMNKLQILDAIAGQLDRHAGNYFVQRDPETGKVLGVTGIDNDMSFGANMTTPDNDVNAHNYLAMPELVDEEFGRRLLQVSDKDIRDTLAGLLSEAEIEATVSRFNVVRDVVRNLEEQGELTAEWGKETLDQQLQSERFTTGNKYGKEQSMVGRELGDAIFGVLFDAEKALEEATIAYKDRKLICAKMRELLVARELDTKDVADLTQRVIDDITRFVDKRGEDKFPELGKEWVDTYVEGAHRRI